MPIKFFKDKTPLIAEDAYIDVTAVIIGDVTIGPETSVWPMAVLRGDINFIKIGARTSIQDGAVLHVTHAGPFNPDGYPLIIGDEVTVGHQAVLHGCTIGNRCLIGIGAIVLDGAVIEDEVLLGAGSLVAPGKYLESGFLYLGSPAKKVRALTEQEREYFRYSADYYAKLQQHYTRSE